MCSSASNAVDPQYLSVDQSKRLQIVLGNAMRLMEISLLDFTEVGYFTEDVFDSVAILLTISTTGKVRSSSDGLPLRHLHLISFAIVQLLHASRLFRAGLFTDTEFIHYILAGDIVPRGFLGCLATRDIDRMVAQQNLSRTAA